MARKLELGQAGDVEVTPQYRDDDGRWRRHPTGKGKGVERLRARAYVRMWDGQVREVCKFVPAGTGQRARAVKACEDAVQERLRVGSGATTSASQSLVKAGESWLALIARSDSGKAPKTVADYTAAWKRYVIADESPIRGLTLSQVNQPTRIRAFLQQVAADHGTAAAKQARNVLSGIIGQAVNDGVLPGNASRQVGSVKRDPSTPDQRRGSGVRSVERDTSRALTRDERDRIIEHADERAAEAVHPRTARKRQAAADLLALMAGTGVRIGEARTLRWEHVDLTAATVQVHGTKSKSSRRLLSLPTWVRDRLAARHEAGTGIGYVFPAPSGTDDEQGWGERVWEQSNAAGEVAQVFRGAGFPWATPHTLRRTVATLLHEAGVPIVKIADQLGHKDPAMTASVYLGRDFEGDKSDLAAML